MASKTSTSDDWPGRRIDFATYARHLTRRRAELDAAGTPFTVTHNNGKRRSQSKKALLKAVDEAAAKLGFEW